jgi:hypothetical protein
MVRSVKWPDGGLQTPSGCASYQADGSTGPTATEEADRHERATRRHQDTVGDTRGWDVADAEAVRDAGGSLREAEVGRKPGGGAGATAAGEEPRGTVATGAEGKPQGAVPGAERIFRWKA